MTRMSENPYESYETPTTRISRVDFFIVWIIHTFFVFYGVISLIDDLKLF